MLICDLWCLLADELPESHHDLLATTPPDIMCDPFKLAPIKRQAQSSVALHLWHSPDSSFQFSAALITRLKLGKTHYSPPALSAG